MAWPWGKRSVAENDLLSQKKINSRHWVVAKMNLIIRKKKKRKKMLESYRHVPPNLKKKIKYWRKKVYSLPKYTLVSDLDSSLTWSTTSKYRLSVGKPSAFDHQTTPLPPTLSTLNLTSSTISCSFLASSIMSPPLPAGKSWQSTSTTNSLHGCFSSSFTSLKTVNSMSVQSIMSYSAPQAPNTSCVPNMAMEEVGMSREGISVGSSNQFGSSQEVGDPGWLMAIADSMVTSSEQSRHMISTQSCSQELQRPKPGESGWLVSITDCLEEGGVDKMKQHLKEKSVKPFSQQPMDMFSVQSSRQDVHRPTPSQDSGKGNSIPSQAWKTYHSQVSSLQSSVSSASELLASDEDTSRVILYKEEVAE